MKPVIGKPDDSEIVLAEHSGGAWRPNPNLAAEMATFLQGADPEQFEMWVEEPEYAFCRKARQSEDAGLNFAQLQRRT